MNESQAAFSELDTRCRWSLASITELVNIGRARGWLPGEPCAAIDSSDLLRSCVSPVESPMQLLAARLGLTTVEVDVLWLLACIELDPHVSTAALLLLPPGMNELSAQLIERVVARGASLEEDVFERLDRLALIHSDNRLPLNRRPLRVSERVLDLARGLLRLDPKLKSIAILESAVEIRRKSVGIDQPLPAELCGAVGNGASALFIASGVEGAGRSTILRHAISACGRAALTVASGALAADETTLAFQLRAIARECRIHDAWPLFTDAEALNEKLRIFERELVSDLAGPMFATAREPCAWALSRSIINVQLAIPNAKARETIWRRALPCASAAVLQACAERYSIAPGVIVKSAEAASAIAGEVANIDVPGVHRALRTHLERRLSGIARRIETKQTWNDLVLPVDQLDLLIEMVARVRHKQRVLEDWGFAEKVGRGLGVSALLSGPPGTGKTMVAGLIAEELSLDLYQVDLSKVVSKYIGETEKQLSALFEAAESGHAILLFDEADSLFAKRTEVKSSNDRYANLEVNYLLQRIEAFSGITILTTNHETAIDQAFMRRLAFHVRVPMPEERERELLWRSMIPDKAERSADVDFTGLARSFEMSGGYIKNAALRAAFLCANEGGLITNEQLWRAARCEYEAMGKISCAPARLSG